VPYSIVDQDGATDSAVHIVEVPNAPPAVIDPDPAPGTPSIDPLDAENIIVPAVDGTPVTIDLDDYLTDPNIDPLTITPVALPPGATFNAVTNFFSAGLFLANLFSTGLFSSGIFIDVFREFRTRLRYRIIPVGSKRVTAAESFHAQPHSFYSSVFLYGFHRILGTTR